MPGDKPFGNPNRFDPDPNGKVYRIKSQCDRCRHLNRSRLTCPAFPNSIPGVIFDNEHDHRQPYPGDHGIRWTPLPIYEDGKPTGRHMTHPLDDEEPDKEVIA